MNTHRKCNIAPENGWLEDYTPFGRVTFQGRTVKLRGGVCSFPRKGFLVPWAISSSQERTWIVQVSSDKQKSKINGLVYGDKFISYIHTHVYHENFITTHKFQDFNKFMFQFQNLQTDSILEGAHDTKKKKPA